MAAKHTRDVTDAELAVLRELWERGPTTIRELTDRLYRGGGTSAYATVQKLLERLEAKACVGRERAQVPHVFAATIDREGLIASGSKRWPRTCAKARSRRCSPTSCGTSA